MTKGFKGKRVRLSSAFDDDKSLTLLAAGNVDAFVAGACQVTDETVDSVAYAAWVEDRLCPCLGDYSKGEPNSIVVSFFRDWPKPDFLFLILPPSDHFHGAVQ